MLCLYQLEIRKKKKISRFEEVEEEEPSKGQKRARESDVSDAITKNTKKNKKLKADGGKSVETDVKEGEKKEKQDDKKDDDKKAEDKDGKKEKKKDKKEKKKAGDTPSEKSTPAKKKIAGGVVIEDAVVGTGPMAKKGNTVRMRYVGKLTNGKEFDKNTSGKPVRSAIEPLPRLLNDSSSSSLSPSGRVKSSKVQ